MVFRKFIEVGRVVMINFGPLAGKLAVIVDIVNTTKILVAGPTTGVMRQEMSIKRISLTEFKLDVPRGVKRDALKKAIEKFDLEKKFSATAWGAKLNRTVKRANLTDFDRFKVKQLRQRRRVLRNVALKSKK